MRLIEALDLIVDDGIEAARLDYAAPRDRLKRAGAIAGFTACRGQAPDQLHTLLAEAERAAAQALAQRRADYWYWRCLAAEIGWVANVVSAILITHGQPGVVVPTARGMLQAASILGVSSARSGGRC